MSELTRRRDTTRNEETWLIFLDDVHIGTIGRRAGVPTDAEQWGWRCGIPSESQRGACTEGTAADFPEARSQFDAAWRKLRPNYTDADFTDYCRARLDGMEADNVGNGLQGFQPKPKKRGHGASAVRRLTSRVWIGTSRQPT
jgi:hypothetical protein